MNPNIKTIETHYDNGQLRGRYTYKNGKLEGLFEAWHKNGKLLVRCTFTNGKHDGLFEAWNESGKLLARCTYKGDVLVEDWEAQA